MKNKLLITLGLTGIIAISVSIGAFAATAFKVTVNGAPTKLDVKVIDKVNYVPLNAFAALVGLDVKTDAKTNAITVTKKVGPVATAKPTTKPEKSPITEVPKSKVSTKKPEEVITITEVVEYINSNRSELLKDKPGSIDVGATYRTAVWLNKGIDRSSSDANTDTVILTTSIENLVETPGDDKVDLRGFSLVQKSTDKEIPSRLVLDSTNHNAVGGLMPTGWPVILKIVFDIPGKSDLSDYILRMYDGKDHVDLKLS